MTSIKGSAASGVGHHPGAPRQQTSPARAGFDRVVPTATARRAPRAWHTVLDGVYILSDDTAWNTGRRRPWWGDWRTLRELAQPGRTERSLWDSVVPQEDSRIRVGPATGVSRGGKIARALLLGGRVSVGLCEEIGGGFEAVCAAGGLEAALLGTGRDARCGKTCKQPAGDTGKCALPGDLKQCAMPGDLKQSALPGT